MNKIQFYDTHVYPGCPAVFSFKVSADTPPALATDIEFSDGGATDGELETVNPGEIVLVIKSYITGSGAKIAAKTWQLKYNKDEDLWKVTAKI